MAAGAPLPRRAPGTILRMAAVWTGVAVMGTGAARPARAQTWNDAPTREIVDRGIALRRRQFADSGLTDYRAQARGYLTFLGQFGVGFPDPPRAVRVDQLAVEVLWKAPNLSRQRLIGLRDTLLLPADISYYRDRYGIVQNNFPDLIRMGDARDVRDVPHPLSAVGRAEYDYVIQDSLTLRSPERTLRLFEVRVRPRDEARPGVIGTLYLERESGAVARMALTFTSAALLDRRIETLTVVIENALIGDWWLPSRQEIEVVRTATWLSFPARGIIRARWDICCYELNVGLDRRAFLGPEFVRAPDSEREEYDWRGAILDSLPDDVRLATDDDVREVMGAARRLVGPDALARQLRGGAFSAAGISDVARVNRAEGLALGAGGVWRLGGGAGIGVHARFGFADERLKGRVFFLAPPVGPVRLTVHAEDDLQAIGDVHESSRIANTIAAGAFGDDFTNPYRVRGVGIAADVDGPVALQIAAAYERHDRVGVAAEPLTGTFEPTTPVWPIDGARLDVTLSRPQGPGPAGFQWGWNVHGRARVFSGRDTVLAGAQPISGRIAARVELERAFGSHTLRLESSGAGVAARPDVPPQDYVFLGGPVSAPGYGFHALTGRLGFTQHVEWRLPIPFFPIGLGRFGRAPPRATLAPFVHAAAVHDAAPFAVPRSGIYPSAGAAVEIVFDLLRFQIARGLRDGGWRFSVDANRRFWGIL